MTVIGVTTGARYICWHLSFLLHLRSGKCPDAEVQYISICQMNAERTE